MSTDAMDQHARTEDLLEHADWIRRLALALVGDRHAAEDVLQDTWLAALRRRPRADASLRPWLGRVARNFAFQRARKQSERPGSDVMPEPVAAEPSAELLAERAEWHARLVSEVARLREPHRATLLLRYYEGLTSAEIARRQGLPEATVRSRLKRGLDELRDRLDAREGPGVWSLVLAPLFLESATGVQGILAMKTTVKAVSAVALLALVAWFGFDGWQALFPDDVVARPVDTPSELEEAPVVTSAETQEPRPDPGREVAAAGAVPDESAEPVVAQAFFQGRLVDAKTGEPLPDFQFRMQHGTRSEALESDAHGGFESVESYPAGAFKLSFDDHPDLDTRENQGTYAFDPASDERARIEVRVGPTYRLQLYGPADLELASLSATVLGDDPGWADTLRMLQAAPVREGELPWVRFAKLATGILPKRAPWQLEVSSTDGLWQGRSEVSSIEGVYSSVVSITLEPFGALTGRITGLGGAPVEGVLVKLTGVKEGQGTRAATTGEDGGFSHLWLQPGTYDLHAGSPRHAEYDSRVVIRPGEDALHDVELDSRADGGNVTVRLESETGTYSGAVIVQLAGRGAALTTLRQDATWSGVEGARVAECVFEEVPPGEYELSVLSLTDSYRWEPAGQLVRPGDGEVTSRCLDEAAARHLGFRVYDQETGDEIREHLRLAFTANGNRSLAMSGLSSGAVHLINFPDDGTLHWSISSEGFAPEYGDEHDLGTGEGVRWTDVRLRKGWGRRILLLTADGDPLPGVQVFGDEVLLGDTDASGRARLVAPVAPKSLRVDHPDWQLVETDGEVLANEELVTELHLSAVR